MSKKFVDQLKEEKKELLKEFYKLNVKKLDSEWYIYKQRLLDLDASIRYYESMMSNTKPGFVEKRPQLQRKHIEKLADNAFEGCDGCTEFEEKMWKEGFIRGYYAAEIDLNQNKE